MPLKLDAPASAPNDAAVIAKLRDQLATCAGGKLKSDPKTGNVEWEAGSAPSPANAFSKALDEAIRSDQVVRLHLRAGPAKDGPAGEKRFFDSFCDRTVYVDHVYQLSEAPPADNPAATTRCEALVHIVAEYTWAAVNKLTSCTSGYEDAHRAGLDAQQAHRRERKQPAAVPQTVKGSRLTFPHEDGSTTVAVNDDGNVTITQTPPKKKAPAAGTPTTKTLLPRLLEVGGSSERRNAVQPTTKTLPPRLFEHADVVFAGRVQSLAEPEPAWSSLAAVHERVSFAVDAYHRGDLGAASLDVHYPVVQYAATGARERPGLSAQVFSPGQAMLVLARWAADPTAPGAFRLEATSADALLYLGTRDRPLPSGERSPAAARTLELQRFDRAVRAVRVTMAQGDATVALEAAPRAGAVAVAAQAVCLEDPLDVTLDVVAAEHPCAQPQGARLVYSGTALRADVAAGTFWLPIAAFVFALKVDIPAALADDDCLKRLRKRLEQLEAVLGLDLTGKTVTLRYDDDSQLGPDDYLRTDPVKGDANAVTMTVNRALCKIDAKSHLYTMIVAHELSHVQRLTGADGKAYRDADDAYHGALAEWEKAVTDRRDGSITDADYNAARKKMHRAKLDALKKLKDEEDKAFDLVKDSKAKLGLSDDDLKQNEKLRHDEQADLDKQIAKEEKGAK